LTGSGISAGKTAARIASGIRIAIQRVITFDSYWIVDRRTPHVQFATVALA